MSSHRVSEPVARLDKTTAAASGRGWRLEGVVRVAGRLERRWGPYFKTKEECEATKCDFKRSLEPRARAVPAPLKSQEPLVQAEPVAMDVGKI